MSNQIFVFLVIFLAFSHVSSQELTGVKLFDRPVKFPSFSGVWGVSLAGGAEALIKG